MAQTNEKHQKIKLSKVSQLLLPINLADVFFNLHLNISSKKKIHAAGYTKHAQTGY